LWILAGPNGCGKSTAVAQTGISEFDGSVWIINPDVLTTRLCESEGLSQHEANLQAVKRIERWLAQSVNVYQTIGVETVLSTAKYRRLVKAAKMRGFEIRLIYVIVDNLEIQLERIRYRVEKGGHDVPENKVRDRRKRSLQQLRWFFRQANYTWIMDNSGAEPRIDLEWQPEAASMSEDLLPEVQIALFGKVID
jgi:predicted ABC-type ATPase